MEGEVSESTEFDLGPLVDLVSEVRAGLISVEAALERAREHGAAGKVTPEQLTGMAAAALEAARGNAHLQALPIAEIGCEAARSAHKAHPDDREFAEAWSFCGANLVEVLHYVLLLEGGNVRLYLRAKEVGEEAMADAAAMGLARLESLLALRMGTLVLDCYTANRSPSNYRGQFDAWVAQAKYAEDPAMAWLVSGQGGEYDPPEWPEPLDALAEAERLLRLALPQGGPKTRGEALKALSQTLEWKGALGGESDEEELRAVSEQALEELGADDERRLSVINTLKRVGALPEEDTEILRRMEEEWPQFLADASPYVAWDAVTQALQLLEDEPERALRLLRRQREIPDAWEEANLRSRHFEQELRLFAHAYAPALAASAWDDVDGALAASREMAAKVDSPGRAREAAAALIASMLGAANRDREADALPQMEVLQQLDASLWQELEPALRYLVANLFRGEGVNRMRAGDFDAAGAWYLRSVDAFVATGMGTPLVQGIEYLDDVVLAGTSQLDELTAWLAANSLRLELLAPAGAPAALNRLAGHVLAAQLSGGTSSLVIQLLFQVAKGRRFAAMLTEGTRDFSLDPETLQMLEREAEAEAALPPGSDVLRPAPFDASLDDDHLITAWVNEYEKAPSESPEDRVANVQRAVERRLSSILVPAQLPPVVSLDAIKARLDEETALLQLFEGPGAGGNLTTFQFLVAPGFERVMGGVEEMPHGAVGVSWRGRSVTMPPSGFYVGDVRRDFQADPGPLDLSPEAEAALPGLAERYLRVVEESADQLREQGVKRLLIAPHGASRFLPIHLFGQPGRPLCDRFTVTYLSSIAQLTVEPPPRRRREGAAVFALSYADQPRLPRLDDSPAEAEAIAAACGTDASVDGAATESAFKAALQSRRYVHLRAHGRLYPDAPSFHTVFLHPADGEDGRLRAYEVLPLDLTGLELVTLGACETALGRVDQSDNPRGLPAALLLAGAQAVAGTLWPVFAEASTCFFTHLYETLMKDEESDVAGAFAAAQRATRERHPQYRDWGAFYLIGGAGRRGAR